LIPAARSAGAQIRIHGQPGRERHRSGSLLGSSMPEVAETIRRKLTRYQLNNGTHGFT
jgi:hypothetical protein